MLDAVTGGAIMKKMAKEAFQLLEDIAMCTYRYHSDNNQVKAIDQIDVERLKCQIALRVMNTIVHNFVNKGVNPTFVMFLIICVKLVNNIVKISNLGFHSLMMLTL